MYVCGIDLGKKDFTACLMGADGTELMKPTGFDNNRDGVRRLMDHLRRHCPQVDFSQINVGMEYTAAYWVNIKDRLDKEGFQVTMLNPVIVKGHSRALVRGRHTDKDSSRDCARVLLFEDIPATHADNEFYFELRELSRLRAELVKEVSSLKNRVLSILCRVFPEFEDLFSDTFGKAAMAVLKESADPEELAAISSAKLTRLIKKASRNRLGSPQSRLVKKAAASTSATDFGARIFSLEVRHLVEIIQELDKHINQLEKEIKRHYEELGISLHTIPGVSIINGSVIASEYGDINRFPAKNRGEKMVAFAGIDAVVRESSTITKKRYMSKRGSPYLRTALYRASDKARQIDPMFARIYQRQIDKDKPHKVAVSHVMNKMVHVVNSVLTTGKKYEPVLN